MQFFKAQEYSKVFKAKIESFVKDTIKLALAAGLTLEFEDGVKTFIEWAKGQCRHLDGDKIRCPCRKCKNTKFGTPDEDYYEAHSVLQVSEEPTSTGHVEVGPSYFVSYHEGVPNDGTRSVPVDVGVVAELVDIKADGHISERIYDRISKWANKILPSDYTLPGYYYSTKMLVKDLSLPVEKIHACKNSCILYWKDDFNLEYCKFYGDGRDFSSEATAEHMTWHATHQAVEGSMCYPSDAEAWKHFDQMYPDFAEEPRNVQLGLCIDGFAPHGQYGRTYSYWPIIITPYNLPPGMCMSSEYIFQTMVIPGLSNPKRLIDVYLDRLIEELLQLWHVGVRTYDHATNRTFMMQAELMWTVNHLPAYGMAFGWSTVGVMECPVCMDDTRAFHL
ncbi:UNVERIFIED_CONTAM: hypothetical protein Sangu_2914800 [Sesamum angustifolium]|uniref:Transposase-associated domain-containing protein n=1 Tax=Sesamum angustifolium TaxID=2727405 RepID=A0AAW2IM59_9LAMI